MPEIIQQRSLYEINREGRAALVQALGVADALRFIGHYAMGQGDYTAERDAWLGDDSLESIAEQVREVEQRLSRDRAV